MTGFDPRPRPLTPDDLSAFIALLGRAFLKDPEEGITEELRIAFEPERGLGVFDGAELVGEVGILTRRMTMPGGSACPVAAVTDVAVAPDHRRRGILRSLMRAQLHGLHERGAEPVAVLWSSEAPIYPRFGYGPATEQLKITVPAHSPFRAGVECSTEGVRESDAEAALPALRALHDSMFPTRIGALSRDERGWRRVLVDTPDRRRDTSALRFALHPEGYAIFRVHGAWNEHGPDGTVSLDELTVTTLGGYTALWRYLLDLDLAARVTGRIGVGEPLIHLLADPRSVRRRVGDALWVRLVDVDRALAARRYATPLDVVLAVTDEFCPWNAGRWRLRADADGAATVTPADGPPDLALDVTDLGAAFLGGTRLSTLAAAGRVRELTPSALRRATLAFLDAELPTRTEDF